MYVCTVGQKKKKKEAPLFISIQIIVQKGNWYQSSWIIVYFNLVRLHTVLTIFTVNKQQTFSQGKSLQEIGVQTV